jgi:hypothetical protein
MEWSGVEAYWHIGKKNLRFSPYSLGLSATRQQYFSLTTNQPPATSQQYFSLRTNQHQPPAKRSVCRPG